MTKLSFLATLARCKTAAGSCKQTYSVSTCAAVIQLCPSLLPSPASSHGAERGSWAAGGGAAADRLWQTVGVGWRRSCSVSTWRVWSGLDLPAAAHLAAGCHTDSSGDTCGRSSARHPLNGAIGDAY